MGADRMDSGQLIATLDSLLASEEAAASALLSALEAESVALQGRDADTLARATGQKNDALAKLEQLERQRREFCARIGAGPGQADMDAWLSTYAAGSAEAAGLRKRWSSLSLGLRRCREINQANGLVVASLQRRVQQALSLIRSGSAEPAVYGPSGGTAVNPPARAIARA